MNKEEKKEIKEQIEELEEEIEELESQDTNDGYDEMLDDTKEYWIKDYYGGDALKELDPIRYNCGLSDYNDERLTELREKIDELKEELEE